MNPQTLLMTRPQDASERFVGQLSDAARAVLDVQIAPLMEIVPTGADLDLNGTDAVIFTSGNGVRLAPDGAGRAAFCVGRRTAAHASNRGWDVQHVAADAEHLIAAMSTGFRPRRITHLAGRHRRGEIDARLRDEGWQVDVVELYEQHLCPLSANARALLSGEAPVILPLFSPRTAAHLSQQINVLTNTQVVALSDAVAGALNTGLSEHLHVVGAPTGDMMAQCVEMLALGHRSA